MKGFGYRLIVLVILLSVWAVACSPTPATTTQSTSPRLAELQKKGQVIVGTAITRPFEYRDATTNELIGFDIDLMTKIMEPLGVKIVWREMAFADLLPELEAGNLDLVIAGMYITPAREDVVDMSTPYQETGLVMATHSGITNIATITDLAGRTVGVKEGSTGERFALSLQSEQNIALEIRRYTDTLDSLEDLDAGRVDVVFNDYINTLEFIKTHPKVRVVGDILQPAGLGISVRSGDADLLAHVNEMLAKLDSDGTRNALFDKWINPETSQ